MCLMKCLEIILGIAIFIFMQETTTADDHAVHLPEYLAYLSLGFFRAISTIITVLSDGWLDYCDNQGYQESSQDPQHLCCLLGAWPLMLCLR